MLFIGACTNQPPDWAIKNGGTCQSILGIDNVDKAEISKEDYCRREDWIQNKTCGVSCAKWGLITDPSCSLGKLFIFSILTSTQYYLSL